MRQRIIGLYLVVMFVIAGCASKPAPPSTTVNVVKNTSSEGRTGPLIYNWSLGEKNVLGFNDTSFAVLGIQLSESESKAIFLISGKDIAGFLEEYEIFMTDNLGQKVDLISVQEGISGDISILKAILNHNQGYNHISAQTRLDFGQNKHLTSLIQRIRQNGKRRIAMQHKKITENKLLIQNQRTKPLDKEPHNHGFKVRTNVQAGRQCWFIPIGPMGDGCLMCDDGSQYC